ETICDVEATVRPERHAPLRRQLRLGGRAPVAKLILWGATTRHGGDDTGQGRGTTPPPVAEVQDLAPRIIRMVHVEGPVPEAQGQGVPGAQGALMHLPEGDRTIRGGPLDGDAASRVTEVRRFAVHAGVDIADRYPRWLLPLHGAA